MKATTDEKSRIRIRNPVYGNKVLNLVRVFVSKKIKIEIKYMS